MNQENGGPAFPIDISNYQSGMTLRDYFAAKAMCGIIGLLRDGAEVSESVQTQIAKSAYQIADVMLKAR